MAFKVVIVGAGPIGLTAAQALNKAGIDYVVLERRDEVVIDIGATIIVSQGTLRVMSQLDLLDRMRDNGCALDRTVLRSIADDASYCDRDLDIQKVNFGEYGHVLHRANLLSVLYDSFSDEDKKKILTNKKVTEVLSDENGVEVKCEDGTSYEGSIVIGADGISSAARKAVRELSAKAGLPDLDGEQPFKTTYRMLWFSAPRPARLKPGRGGLSFGKPASVQLLVGKDKCWIFLYERLEKETRERFFYSEREMLDLMDKWGHLTCDDGLAVRDVFATRYKAGLINVEEGVVKQWSQGRVVLAGDSIHKFTPSAGLGYNNGVQDITVCLNEVLRLVRADPNPSVQALKGAFERYQTIRTPHLMKDYEASAMATRYQAYETFTLWFVDRFIMRFFGFAQRGLLNLGHPERTKITRPLEFLPGTEPFTGKIPWDFPMSTHAAPIR